ncbi:MAG: ATP-binding protein [Candidatus Fimisoma sp.]|nr:ATP-binding protein [Candidatus Fimisoma sp.]
MTKRIFRSTCFVAIAVLIACIVLIMGALYSYFSSVQMNQLHMQTALAAQGVNNEGLSYFDGLDISDYRITLVSPDGSVLYDCRADAGTMENHLKREEIQEALKNGEGESRRFSSTLSESSLYCAQKLNDGSVLRLSVAQKSIFTLVLGMSQPICVVLVVAIVLSLYLAYRLSKNIVRPLNELDLDDPLSNNDGYDELSPLLKRIDRQQKQLKRQANEMQKKQDEFTAITESMNEGLILLNPKGTIISINPAAAKLLDAGQFSKGKNILTVNRSLALQEVISDAVAGKSAEKIIELHERHYQVDASPVISDGAVGGIVLLLFDVTEKEDAEQLRREFTANVSHELKTPLHSISGYAEIIKSDLISPEDIKPFASKIYSEAQRMIQLVEDIINLSHLDEGADSMSFEDCDLYLMAQDTVANLSSEADASDITVTLSGDPAVIKGVPHMLSGIIYNLCDNAIKYNRPGGKVNIDIRDLASSAILSVRDTGIGIPPEHQNRIFERFYRVDKSHSKEVGGTGLGLSIVKHAAKIHGAKVSVESTPGEGTCISLEFPK